MNNDQLIFWCERCFREGETRAGRYFQPELRNGRIAIGIRKGFFCHSCHRSLSIESVRRILIAFPHSIKIVMLLPVAFSLTSIGVRKWLYLSPINGTMESIPILLGRYKSLLKNTWPLIYQEVKNSKTVPLAVRNLQRATSIPPGVIFAAIRFLRMAQAPGLGYQAQ